jgi:hypothetical protein
VVLIGERPYSAPEVEAAIGVTVIGVLAQDERAAGLLNGEPGRAVVLSRSALMRSARSVASTVYAVGRAQEAARRTVLTEGGVR